MKQKGFVKFHIDKAKEFLNEMKKTPYTLKGFEDLELSTQILLKAAIKNGVKFEILDRDENFIVLEKENIIVPQGKDYFNIEEAKSDYRKYGAGIVIKPKSTNFGLGITIFKEEFSKEDYEKALEIAFKEDNSILIERFIKGKEYRIFGIC